MRFLAASAGLGILLAGVALRGQAVPMCRAAQLEPFVQDDECGMGRCDTGLLLRNVSATACSLPGHPQVTALGPRGTVLRKESTPTLGSPIALGPGEFGEYQSESFSLKEFKAPAAAATYLFRLSDDDPGELRLPGNESLASGPDKPYADDPVPDLSLVARVMSGEFTFSAFRWPVAEKPQGGADAAMFDSDRPSLQLHVSVANRLAADRAGWGACRIVMLATEDGAAGPGVRSDLPCAWNGDIRRGTIAAGATVAREVSAALPKVCHRAKYTVAISLAGAPVSFAPIMLHTVEFQPLCSDSKVSVAQAAPDSATPAATPGLKAREVQWGLPVGGIRLGLELPVRRYLEQVIAIDEPRDKVVATVWVDNQRDTALHLAGAHGFHLRILNGTPAPGTSDSNLAVEMKAKSGSDETGPLDVTVPPHTEMRVATLDLGAEYDFAMGPVPRQEYLVGISPDALTGADDKLNWASDQKNVWSLKALTSFRVEPPGVSK